MAQLAVFSPPVARSVMEGLIILFLIVLGIVSFILPIWAFFAIGRLDRENERLRHDVELLDWEVKKLRDGSASQAPIAPRQAPVSPNVPATTAAPAIGTAVLAEDAPAAATASAAGECVTPAAVPPGSSMAPEVLISLGSEPPPLDPETKVAAPPDSPPAAATEPPAPGWLDRVDWEQFMGAKLFAWLGGLALFLGVAFFVKYAFEHDLIPPEVRVALGFLVGAGLIVGGLRMDRARYGITCQTLIATGVVSLYAVTFACNAVYHFPFFGLMPTFLLMMLITTAAFVLAVQLEAQVVAILGLLGGFLTPGLLSTGHDNAAGLFGYVALLDAGLVAVALQRSWLHLVPLGAGGTVLTMIGWMQKHYASEKMGVAMAVCMVFTGLFLVAHEFARRRQTVSPLVGGTALALPVVAFCFAGFFLDQFPAGANGMWFGFVLLITLACFHLAWREEQGWIIGGAAGAGALLLLLWTGQVFEPGRAPVLVAACLGSCVVYLGAYLLGRRLGRVDPALLWSAVAMPVVAFGFAGYLLTHPAVAARPGLILGFVFAADAILLLLAWLDDRLDELPAAGGLGVFVLLAAWTAGYLTEPMLPWALAGYLVFAALHTVFPTALARVRPAAGPGWSQFFPPLALLLMLGPLFKLESASFLLWPAMLLVDLLAIALAVLTGTILVVAAVLVLTLAVTGVAVFRVPVDTMFPSTLLLVIGGFGLFFFAATLWLARRLGDKLSGGADAGKYRAVLGDVRTQLPAMSSLLPFVLLILVCARLPVRDPSSLFGLALLLVVLTLGLARIMAVEWLPACALAGAAGLAHAWHARHFTAIEPLPPLLWYLAFHGIFAAYPFLFRRQFAGMKGPWAVAALSGVALFPLVHRLIGAAWPNGVMGLVPAAFAAAPLLSLLLVRRQLAEGPVRLSVLAWYGGVALFFITLVFPIQFERQWLTVAWALEGAALCWLFHRIPHPGLRVVGVALLAAAFARLALNPAVLGYHARGETPILNWYLYAYGLTTAALATGARLLAPPRERVLGIAAPPLLNTLAAVLGFVLLNLEIADYFTAPGARALVFQFSGDFARDMTYTIAWALYALGLLAAGLWRGLPLARHAGIGLLSVALLKLFLHDLARLEALYRVGALFGVAVIAIAASFAYQRFLPGHASNPPKQD